LGADVFQKIVGRSGDFHNYQIDGYRLAKIEAEDFDRVSAEVVVLCSPTIQGRSTYPYIVIRSSPGLAVNGVVRFVPLKGDSRVYAQLAE
jgi:hypothetical protein